MRTIGHVTIFMSLALTARCVFPERPGLAAGPPTAESRSPSVPEIEREAASLENVWQAGKHCEYFVEADGIALRLREAVDKKGAAKVAAGLLKELLARRLDVDEITDHIVSKKGDAGVVEVSDLSAMSRLVVCITNYGGNPADGGEPLVVPFNVRARYVKLLADVLGRIRKEEVPNYKEKDVYLNVSVPPGIITDEPGESGMDPDEIKNPVARAKFKAAIRENVASQIYNSRQQDLAADDRQVAPCVKDYMIATFRARKSESALLADCIERARLTAAEKKSILAGIAVEASAEN